MILDRIENAERYVSLHPRFGPAFAFLRATDLASLSDGRHAVDDDRIFVVVARGEGRGREGASLEAHRRYIDIQLTLEGIDAIGYKPTASCTDPQGPFDEDKDVVLYKDAPDTWTPLPPGMLAIYFPEDAHAPLGCTGAVRKAVVKILI